MMTIPPFQDGLLASLFSALAGEDSFILLETTRITEEDHRSFLFRKPTARLQFNPGDDIDRFFMQAEEFLRQGYYLAGWFAYEFGLFLEPVLTKLHSASDSRALVDLGVFPQPHIFDHHCRRFITDAGPWPGYTSRPEAAALPEHAYELADLRLSQTREEYLRRIKLIQNYIAAGDTYQVNYTIKYLFDFLGSPEALYRTLRGNQQVAYSAFINFPDRQIISLSPELFFRRSGSLCQVRPMKGTCQRGRTLQEDQDFQEFLRHDPKNRSENVMIVDLLRNDLGRLCTMGEVSVTSLFDIETYRTLHQMTSSIQGSLAPGISLAQIFGALFPCGSVTGAPKIRTMEIIRELENGPRGVYTGAIGSLTPNGEAMFNVPIRTLTIEGGKGEMGIGSGIVSDSDPEKEWQECQLKGNFLTVSQPEFQLLETLRWQPSTGYWLVDLHCRRLQESAHYFGFPLDAAVLQAKLSQLAASFPPLPHRVRLVVDSNGAMTLTSVPLTDGGTPDELCWPAAPLPVTISAMRTDPSSPFLYHKTTIRNLYDDERTRATAASFFEVIFCNIRNEVTEGAISTVFIRRGHELHTPPVECGLLPGIFRHHLLSLSRQNNLVINGQKLHLRETILTVKDLQTADRLYVGNSVRGMIPVQL